MNNLVISAIEKERTHMLYIRKSLYENPEIGLQEYRSSELLCNLLLKNKFKIIKPYAGLKTGFIAKYESDKKGCNIGILAEFDALPEIGHACGHNLISSMSYGAACGIKAFVEKNGGKITLFGTPDEEGTSGKINFIRAGAFEDIDFAMMCHPSTHSVESGITMGLAGVKFEFFGTSAHAAQPKEYCKNALDAAVFAYLSINNMKQYIPDANIYGIIDNGGIRPNIIPDYTSMKYYVRATSKDKLEEYVQRTTECAKNAALSCGVRMEMSEFENRVDSLKTNHTMMAVFKKNYESLSHYKMIPSVGHSSTSDMGNVSNVVPAIQPWIAITDEDLPLHHRDFAKATMTDKAALELENAAKAMALTCCNIASDPKLLETIKYEFTNKT